MSPHHMSSVSSSIVGARRGAAAARRASAAGRSEADGAKAEHEATSARRARVTFIVGRLRAEGVG